MDKFSKEITLYMKTSQKSENGTDCYENIYKGKMFYSGEVFHIFYEDEGAKSTIHAKHDYVEIIRGGGYGARLVYEQGKSFKTMYSTPYGEMPLVLLPHKVLVALDKDGGKICLDYDMSLAGQKFKNCITVRIV